MNKLMIDKKLEVYRIKILQFRKSLKQKFLECILRMHISFDLTFFLGSYCWPVSKKDYARCSRGLTHCSSSCICVFFKWDESPSGSACFFATVSLDQLFLLMRDGVLTRCETTIMKAPTLELHTYSSLQSL